jgi:hypothetical protein
LNHRINVSFSSKEFHSEAVKHAMGVHHTDLSGYITKLIVDDMRRERELRIAERKRRPDKTKRSPGVGPGASVHPARTGTDAG